MVLGTDGDDWLRGGSSDDILCGFGGDDVLEGGSGSDYLDAGTGSNALYGGSGADTLIGMEGDVFAGGSGRNEVIRNAPLPDPIISVSFSRMEGHSICYVDVTLTGFAPGTYTVDYHNDVVYNGNPFTVDDSAPGISVGSEPVTVAGIDHGVYLDPQGGPYTVSTVQVTVGGVSTDAITVTC